MSEYRYELSNAIEVLEKTLLDRVVILITFNANVEIDENGSVRDYLLSIEDVNIKVLQNNNGISIEAFNNFEPQITGLCKRFCKIYNYHLNKGVNQRQFELELFHVVKHKEEWDRPEHLYLIGAFKRRINTL
jgi:hypothetical protein